jgi:hypothetical protein
MMKSDATYNVDLYAAVSESVGNSVFPYPGELMLKFRRRQNYVIYCSLLKHNFDVAGHFFNKACFSYQKTKIVNSKSSKYTYA